MQLDTTGSVILDTTLPYSATHYIVSSPFMSPTPEAELPSKAELTTEKESLALGSEQMGNVLEHI
jgi:hypothetical protein